MKKLLIALALVFQLSQPVAVSHSVNIERVYDAEHDIMVMTVIDDNGESWTFEDVDTEAIRTISTKPENMANLEYYLSSHFDK